MSGQALDTSWPRLNCPEVLAGSPEQPRLLGSRCTACGEPFFPPTSGCTRCCAQEMEPYDLGSRGHLWSWTLQAFEPKPPYDGTSAGEEFAPFAVGYVAMPCGLKVESRLLADADALAIGQAVRLVLEPYRRAPDGALVHTFAFRPEAS